MHTIKVMSDKGVFWPLSSATDQVSLLLAAPVNQRDQNIQNGGSGEEVQSLQELKSSRVHPHS